MINKKYAGIACNEMFIAINTCSFSGWVVGDPKGEDIYLEPLADCRIIGDAVLKALAKSRDLSISEEDRQALIDKKVTRQWIREKYPESALFTPVAVAERYKEWVQRVMKEYKCKTKKALFQNMQSVSVDQDNDCIEFSSSYHLTIDSWGNPDGKTPSIRFKIPTNSTPEIIGAAVKYAIGNCRGKGADFMRNLLFPDGQPETLEEYLKQLKIL